MAKIRISPVLIIGLLIIIFFGISLIFRIQIPYNEIFVGDNIKYASNDAYYYMRLVDNMSYNFPHLTQFDPYFLYPGGNTVTSIPTFHWLIVVIAWIVGLGNPTTHTIDIIGTYLPAIMGALTIIPVFFIGKTLFNKWVGVFAAGLLAFLPGEFLSRSLLGSGDNPVAEVLFTTTALAFLIAAIKKASQSELTFNHIIQRDWRVMLKPLILSILGGVFLGFYLTTWQGALIFVFIFLLYLLIQFIINHLHKKPSEYLCIVSFTTLLFALIILLLNPMTSDITLAMVASLFVPLVLYGISKLISTRGLKEYFYPLSIVVIGVLVAVIVHFAAPGIFSSLWAKFKFVFFPVGATARTTIEMFPILIPQGVDYNNVVAWGNFTNSFFIAPWWLIFGIAAAAICGYLFYINDESKSGVSLMVFLIITTVITIIFTATQLPNDYSLTSDQIWFIPGIAFISFSIMFYSFVRGGQKHAWYISALWVIAILITLSLLMVFTAFSEIRWLALLPLAMLIYVLFKRREGGEYLRLFILWSLIILIIMMVQRRFGYYFAVNVALLSGYLAWQVVWQSGIKRLFSKREQIDENVHISKTKMKRLAQSRKRGATLSIVNVILAVVIVFFLVFCPNIPKGETIASNLIYAPSDAWQAALVWMKDNTPDPMGDPDAYYQLYEAPPPGESFVYPASAYGVTAWWDYGYWIIRIAHRIPSTNPSQSPDPIRKVAAFFLSTDSATEDELRKELGSSYIIGDYQTATSKFWAMLNWAGVDQEKYLPTYYVAQENQLYPIQAFGSEYYRTLFIRLYNFNGQAVTETKPTVVAYQEVRGGDGNIYKQVVDAKEFVSYQDALNYVNTQDSSLKYDIISTDPFVSPIPLEALEDYLLVYSTPTPDDTETPEIKIFEYIGDN